MIQNSLFMTQTTFFVNHMTQTLYFTGFMSRVKNMLLSQLMMGALPALVGNN